MSDRPGRSEVSKRAVERRALVEREILDRAAELFARRGYTGTSLQDVAEALGMSRTALYYYMSSKEAILGRLVENLSARNAATLAALAGGTLAPEERLRGMAREIAFTAASNPQHTRILTENRHHLAHEVRERDRAAERAILRAVEETILEGIQAGVFRAVAPRAAALTIVGMCVWTAWWVASSEPDAVEVLAGQVADQALLSLVRTGDGPPPATPRALIGTVRAQLDELHGALDV